MRKVKHTTDVQNIVLTGGAEHSVKSTNNNVDYQLY